MQNRDRSRMSAATLAAGLLAASLLAGPAAAQPLKIRKNIACLDDREVANFEHAVTILKQRDQEDKRSWDYWVAVHGDFDIAHCLHGNELIFPWHRSMLYHFEKLLQAADPPRTSNVTLPYWDLSAVPSGDHGYPRAYEKPGSTLSVCHLLGQAQPCGRETYSKPLRPPYSGNELRQILGLGNWPDFGGRVPGKGRLELGPHDFIHGVYVNGLMGAVPTAAADPIFYALHAELDRLWADWQQRNPGKDPVQLDKPKWNGQIWEELKPPLDTARSVLKISDLGYAYGPADCGRGEKMAEAPRAVNEDLPQGGTVTTFPFKLPAAGRDQLRLVLGSVPVDAPSTRVFVFLHPANQPYKPGDQHFADAYLAANVTLWQSSTGKHPHAAAAHPAASDLDVVLFPPRSSLLAAAAPQSDWVITMVVTAAARARHGTLAAGPGLKFSRASLQLGSGGTPVDVALTPARKKEGR